MFGNTAADNHNPMKVSSSPSLCDGVWIGPGFLDPVSNHCSVLSLSQDIEVSSPPDDSISCLSFSPPPMPGNFLIAGSWANDVSNKVLCCVLYVAQSVLD